MTYPQLDLANQTGTKVTIHTSLGDLNIQLFDELAPKTVKNFVELSKKDYYNGQIFHRIIENFMIQGGDPTGTGTGGESIYGRSFEDEFSMDLFNLRGALSMANAGPNTNGSQFFIVQNHEFSYPKETLVNGGWPEEIADAYVANGGTPHLDGHHTVFGKLIDAASFETLDKIANVKVGPNDKPIEDVVLESVTVEAAESKKKLD